MVFEALACVPITIFNRLGVARYALSTSTVVTGRVAAAPSSSPPACALPDGGGDRDLDRDRALCADRRADVGDDA